MVLISPSMLSCDFACIGEQTKQISLSGADMIHLDVMDGVFVPNITFGAPVIKAIRKYSDRIFDVHLMIQDPLKYIEDFKNAGADLITFHLESGSDANETIEKIRSLSMKACVSIKPATPAEAVFPFLDKVDMILVMTVEPGFGGQKFMADMLPKIRIIKEEIDRRKLDVILQADGGIGKDNMKALYDAGVRCFAVGSSVFKAEDWAEAISGLKDSVK
ncbi:MAG: ribulose-phosphate 3-epimerase [Clostridia bacterium]|nr:ribulose-phosphate 3-epimerase [Clostridia bacterium]